MSSGDANDGLNVEDPKLIRIKVENVKDLDDLGVAKEKRIDGFPWKITFYRGETDHLEVSVKCQKSQECRVWDCELEGEVKLLNQFNDTRSMCKPIPRWFSFDGHRTRCLFFGKLDEIVRDEEFVVDGNIIFEVKIDVKGGNGDRFRKRTQIDFFSPSKLSDVILSVEGNKLHVSKQILANASKYFDILFNGNFEKSEENEIVIDDDVPFEDFLTVLEMIYDTGRELDETNLEGVLMVADRFQVQNVLNEAEDSLVGDVYLPDHLTLLLCDLYNFYHLKARCLKYTRYAESFERLMTSESAKRYSEELKNEIKEWRNNYIANELEKIKNNRDNYEKRNKERLEKLMPKPDFLSPSRLYDVVLVVEGEKFYASKQILAHASPYFENLFYDDPEKINEKEFVIEDVSSKEFLITLELIYDIRKDINMQDAEFLLKIASRFNVETIAQRAEAALFDYFNNSVPLHKILFLAEQFNLEIVRKNYLKRIHKCREIVDLMDSESYSQYSSELKIQLLEKMAELWKIENP